MMFKKISIKWRLTILSAFLLTICCLGLTIVLNFSTFNLVDRIDATIVTIPSIDSTKPQNNEMNQEVISLIPSMDTDQAKIGYSLQSIIYMLIVIFGGSGLTFYISGKVLNPLDILNGQVKNINVNNLSETLVVPSTKDEIAELTQSFNEMTDKLDNAFAMQKRFSASAAHELRTPLAVLQTKVDVFKKKNIHTNDEYELLIDVFEKQIHRLRSLVVNLLDMTNMDYDIEKSMISLQDIFEDIISELSIIAKDKNILLSLNCDNSTIMGNVDLLYRAFYNLIENAIKYNIDDGTVQIDVRKISKGQVEILIKDSGIGIPDDMKKHIFEPFYRVDKSRSRSMGGVGLGLTIVDSIVKKHRGTISILDNQKDITCFRIII